VAACKPCTIWRAASFEAGSLTQGVAFIALVASVSWLVDLPLGLYRSFRLEARFGFNRLTPGLFIADTLKGVALAALIGLPLIAFVLWLMGPWANAGGCMCGPSGWASTCWCCWSTRPSSPALFNKFKPLEDGPLKAASKA
jgi:STE24 endopeptidase